jgi:hypothetical protein
MALAALALKRCLKGLDVNGSEFTKRQCADVGDDIVLNNSTMPNCGLSRNAAFNINAQPMFEIFRNAHLRWIDIRPLVATIEESIQLSLRFPLGATERDVARQSLSAGGIATKIEFEFPRLLAALTNVALPLVAH